MVYRYLGDYSFLHTILGFIKVYENIMNLYAFFYLVTSSLCTEILKDLLYCGSLMWTTLALWPSSLNHIKIKWLILLND